MIHSRPGFQTRVTREGKKEPAPAAVTADMEPAFAKHSRAQPKIDSPLKHNAQPALPVERMQAEAEAAFARMKAKAVPTGKPDIIPNPTPSPAPILTDPHQV